MRSKFRLLPLKEERVQIALDTNQKQRLFDAAAAKGVSASHLVRQGIALAVAASVASCEEA